MITGNVHSIETMGLLDGPGIRTVFFMQGCPLRCAYCHNPDTQSYSGGNVMTPEDVLKVALRYKPYFERSGGGVTFSGGEPLMQGKFLSETLKLLKENGIGTAIDTCGYGNHECFSDILRHTDCVIMDIKQMDDAKHKELVGAGMYGRERFMKSLSAFDADIWIRHVMVPGYTDNEASMDKLMASISKLAERIEKIEILPYHKNGVEKYSELGLEFRLHEVPEMDAKRAAELEAYVMERLCEHKSTIRLTQVG